MKQDHSKSELIGKILNRDNRTSKDCVKSFIRNQKRENEINKLRNERHMSK